MIGAPVRHVTGVCHQQLQAPFLWRPQIPAGALTNPYTLVNLVRVCQASRRVRIVKLSGRRLIRPVI